jgi:ethanolamine permease
MFTEAPAWVTVAVPILAYVVCVAINAMGSRVSLRVLLLVTMTSVAVLLIWGISMLPHADGSRWLDIAPEPGESAWFPHGSAGIVAALPAAGWFYLAIEGVPLAAEETRDPARALPRGMIAGMLSLVGTSLLVLTLAPAVAGSSALVDSTNPLPAAVEVALGRGFVYWLTTIVGFAGLLASFFSIIFAYSRQIFALSRAGYLPRWLSKTNRRGAPHWALIAPAILGYAAIQIVDATTGDDVPSGDLLMQVAVFAALVSYVMMMVSHILLRRRFPALARPYKTPGYPVTPVIALVLSLVALSSSLFYGVAALGVVIATLAVIGVGLLYFGLYSRHHLVASAPEEEAALIVAAERELDAR